MRYKRVMLTRFGGPEELRVETVEGLPEPALGEIRVRVLTAGTGFTDTIIRQGQDPTKKICKVLDVSTIAMSEATSSLSFRVQRLNFRKKPDLDTLYILLVTVQVGGVCDTQMRPVSGVH